MKKALVVGGNRGIGLAIALKLLKTEYEHIYIVGKGDIALDALEGMDREVFENKTSFSSIDLNSENYSVFDEINDIDTLVITAGFGRVALFEDLREIEIRNLIKCNELAAIQIIRKYYSKIKSAQDFNCAVLVSIAGHIASPYFSVYGAAKSGLAAFIENINTELIAGGFKNRILDVSPGSLKGTAFNGEKQDLACLDAVVSDIIDNMFQKEILFIPGYEQTYKDVIERYRKNAVEFGVQSYKYKEESGRISDKPQMVIGYLSGTFDLFHIGHLRLLERAKAQCDYLVVGVHESAAWKGKQAFIPFEERKAIVESIKYVDKAIMSYPEDADAWSELHYDKLFVGSDYKGSDRFRKYEEYFAGKGVEIVYFPYTTGTSSTQLRAALSSAIDGTKK